MINFPFGDFIMDLIFWHEASDPYQTYEEHDAELEESIYDEDLELVSIEVKKDGFR